MSVGDKIFGFKMFDSPDGQDTLYKAVHSAKGASAFGLCFGAIDVIAITKPVGIPMTVGLLLNYAAPAAAAGAVYATTTNIVGEYRGKTGPLNHGIGGCAAGFIFGAKARSLKVGVPACMAGAVLGSVTKDRMMAPPVPVHKTVGTLNSYGRTWGAGPRSDIKAPTDY